MKSLNEYIGNTNEAKRTYEEWKHDIFQVFNKKDAIVDAVWNSMYEYAEREGFASEMEEDEKDIIDLINSLCQSFTKLKR